MCAVLGLGLLSSSCLISAATFVEYRIEQEPVQLWLQGDQVRLSDLSGNQYMLMDVNQKTLYLVEETQQILLDLSAALRKKPARKDDQLLQVVVKELKKRAEKYDIDIEHVGAGPVVAGFPTQRYRVVAADEVCVEYMISKEATSLFSADLLNLIRNQDQYMPAGSSLVSLETEPQTLSESLVGMGPCELGEYYLEYTLAKYGVPLRVMDDEGTVEHEMVRVIKNAVVPSGGFTVPANYQKVSLEQLQGFFQTMQEMANQGEFRGKFPPEYVTSPSGEVVTPAVSPSP